MEKTDLAYIAGIIDGEGSIYASLRIAKGSGERRYSAQIRIEMVDKEALLLIQACFGGNILTRVRKELNRQPLWVWVVAGEKAQVILKAILPYLLVKRNQAEVALRIIAVHPLFKHYTPMERFLQEADAKALIVLNK